MKITSTVTLAATALVFLSAAIIGNLWGDPADESAAPATRPAATASAPVRSHGPRGFGLGPGRGAPALTPEQAAEVLAFAKEHAPGLYEQLDRVSKEDPDRYRGLLQSVYGLYTRVQRFPPDVRDAALARHRINIQIYRAVRELRTAQDAATKEKLTTTLKDLLTEQFDKDQIVKEYDVKRLTQQLAELKGEIEQQKTNRQAVIADRLKRLLERPTATSRAADKPARAVEASP